MASPDFFSKRVLWVCAASVIFSVVACSAVYPEVATPTRVAQSGQVLDPPPPDDIKWIAFRGATIPLLTRDGRHWGSDFESGLPDPYAKLLANGAELLRTTADRGTLTPTWANAPAGNFRLRPEDRLRVEVWDARVINDHPIGIREIGRSTDASEYLEEVELECESGVKVRLSMQPAKALFGYGLFYELRTFDAYVSRVLEESPASRAGIRAGDQIVSVDDEQVHGMAESKLRQFFSASHPDGIRVSVQHPDGAVVTVLLREGPIYALYREVGSLR